ncbi:excalibur calcium-binding domain-containing protein [Dietzia maris]|uniref:excalibur calcium-binding domain-containing protein n=1 Tax=Dietzia maris TaxID=37915 RepID=UPI0037CBDD6C
MAFPLEVLTMIRRSLTALGLATLVALGAAPSAVAAEIPVGSGVIAVPDIAPIVVPVPMGFDAAALPLLPFPLVWAPQFMPAPVESAPATTPVRRLSGCREAWDLGVAPIHRGSEYYDPSMDGDNDGIACERDNR